MIKLDPAALPEPPTSVDLSGFPLLRLGQLSCIGTDTLLQSMALLRKQLGRKDEASKGGEPLNALCCHMYARRQFEAMVKELERRDTTVCQLVRKEKCPFLSSAAIPQSEKTARPHMRSIARAYPPLLPVARFLKAPSPPPATSPSSAHIVIRSSRPKPSIRGGHKSRAVARARMQQYKAWRLEGGKQNDPQETGSDDTCATFLSPSLSPLLPALLSISTPSSPTYPLPFPSAASPAEPAPRPPLLLSPAPLPVHAPSPPPLHLRSNSSSLFFPTGPLPGESPLQTTDGNEDGVEEPTQSTSTSPVCRQFYFRLGTSPSRPEVQSIVANVFADAFPDWRRWPGDVQDDDDSSKDVPLSMPQDETWHLLWTWSKPRMEYASLLAHQHVNHIPRSRELTRKDLLARHLDRHLALSSGSSSSGSSSGSSGGITRLTASARARGRHQQCFPLLSNARISAYPFFHIMPQTFALPQAYTSFVATFRDGSNSSSSSSSFSSNIWIIKPIESSRGRGIKVVNDLLEVIYSEPSVIQRYISKPLLLNGYKFDLRLYVLVNSFQPTLEAFLYTEGFARFCTAPFQLHDLSNTLPHVSNSSVQTRHAIRGQGPPLPGQHPLRSAPSADVGGSKLRLSYLWQHLRDAYGIDTAAVWSDIVDMILKSLVCVEDVIPSQPGAFELFGYDVLLDSELWPWLLEINASPSLARDHALDREVKEALIVDTIKVTMREEGQQQNKGESGEELGAYQRLCPGTKAHRKVQAYKRRYVRTTNKMNAFK